LAQGILRQAQEDDRAQGKNKIKDKRQKIKVEGGFCFHDNMVLRFDGSTV